MLSELAMDVLMEKRETKVLSSYLLDTVYRAENISDKNQSPKKYGQVLLMEMSVSQYFDQNQSKLELMRPLHLSSVTYSQPISCLIAIQLGSQKPNFFVADIW